MPSTKTDDSMVIVAALGRHGGEVEDALRYALSAKASGLKPVVIAAKWAERIPGDWTTVEHNSVLLNRSTKVLFMGTCSCHHCTVYSKQMRHVFENPGYVYMCGKHRSLVDYCEFYYDSGFDWFRGRYRRPRRFCSVHGHSSMATCLVERWEVGIMNISRMTGIPLGDLQNGR